MSVCGAVIRFYGFVRLNRYIKVDVGHNFVISNVLSMEKMKTCVVLSFFLLASAAGVSYAEALPVCLRSLDVDDGLSQNMVYSIHQDSRGYMWFGTQDGLNRFDGHSFKVYKHNPSDPYSVGANGFFSMLETPDRRIWLATMDGISVYDPTMDRFTRFRERSTDGCEVSGVVRALSKGVGDDIWIACQNGDLFRWNPLNLMEHYDLRPTVRNPELLILKSLAVGDDGCVYIAHNSGLTVLDPEDGSQSLYLISETNVHLNDINAVMPLTETELLVGTSKSGVLSLNLESGTFRPFLVSDDNGQPLYVRCIFRCSDRMMWIGTESGLYICDSRSREFMNMKHSLSDPYSLSDNAVYAVYEDRDEGIWVGTYFGGVNYLSKTSVFRKYYPTSDPGSIGGRSISEFAKDGNGGLWIGTEDAGLFRFNPEREHFASVPIGAGNIHALMCEDDDLWVGTFTKGLYQLNVKDMKVRRRWTTESGLRSDNVYSIYRDSYGCLWVGTMPGLQYYDVRTGHFVPVLEDQLMTQVNDIMEDRKGLLWFASLGEGIWIYDTPRNKWRHYPQVGPEEGRFGKYVTCLLEDAEGRIWVGTEGAGLYLYDSERDTFELKFNSYDGLLNDVVYSLKCDRMGNVWGSTNTGLFRIDTRTMAVTTYTHENGLLCDQFNYKSGFSDPDGTMYFGSIKGFVSFRPENMYESKNKPNILISSLHVNNEEVSIGDPAMPLLSRSMAETDELRIPYDITTFSLGINEINYAPSQNSVYYYKLDGWDNVWLTAEMPYRVTYSNLPSGTYVFRVRASIDDGEGTDAASLKIIMRPPLWKTWGAYMIYVMLMAAILWLAVLIFRKQMKRRKEEEDRVLAEEREKEIYKAKIEFFSNITHEIRTPLSLIGLPLDEIIKKTPQNNLQYKNLLIIRDNVERLMSLVNQLLDFRKVSGGKEDVQFKHVDSVRVIKNTLKRFAPAANVKKLQLEAHMPDTLPVDVDVEMLTKMTSNLLSNALKHAREKIDLTLSENGEFFTVSVVNDGDMIPEEMNEKIFNPFYKVNENTEGFGIGLPYVRSLAELHSGCVSLVHRNDNLTEFVVELPVAQENTIRLTEDRNVDDEAKNYVQGESLSYGKTVLLVDNDTSFVDFMSRQMSVKYKVMTAFSAESALELLGNCYVDIVVTDIKMPGMSGIELCESIKGNKRYANIPVIILTNEVSRETKVAGVAAGADAYISKPCYIEYLILCIENQFKSGYASEVINSADKDVPVNVVYTKADESFMNRLTELIYSHIEEVDLDVNKLASLMNMSRATLYRKVKESLRVTPNDYIRIIRLKKAAELLRQKEYRINEIAYIVGFSSSSYFSKCFRKQYGVLPKDFS